MKFGELVIPVAPFIFLASVMLSLFVARLMRKKAADTGELITKIVLTALVISRLSFVGHYLPAYRSHWMSILDFRDLGFAPVAGIVASAAMLLYVFVRKPPLRRPLGLAAAAGLSLWITATAARGLTDEPTMPPVSLTDTNGKVHRFGQASGKPVVVNLWASWCGPCRAELPALAQAQREIPGIELDFVNEGESASVVREFLAEQKLAPDNVILDSGLSLARTVQTKGFPTTLFFDGNGKLLAVHLGPFSRATFQNALEELHLVHNSEFNEP